MKPRYLEIPFYRKLVLDHMACAYICSDSFCKDLESKENVWEETVKIAKARTQNEIRAYRAFYIGQLALLDYIEKMQNQYITMQ